VQQNERRTKDLEEGEFGITLLRVQRPKAVMKGKETKTRAICLVVVLLLLYFTF
jgi:hypothetical protein